MASPGPRMGRVITGSRLRTWSISAVPLRGISRLRGHLLRGPSWIVPVAVAVVAVDQPIIVIVTASI